MNIVILFSSILVLFQFYGVTKCDTSHDRKIAHRSRQAAPQDCDLICPGQPPFKLPPDFLHVCTVGGKPPNTSRKPPTTTKRGAVTTTEGGDESTEEGKKTTPTNGTKSWKHHGRLGRRIMKNRQKSTLNRHFLQTKQKILKQSSRRQRVTLKRGFKSKIFKSKQAQDRFRLNGCYVVCNDDNNDSVGHPYEPPPPYGGDEPEDSEEDEDNYVEGEDSPIEIIYVPPAPGQSQRPANVFRPSNDFEVEPFLEHSFDDFFSSIFRAKKKEQRKKQRQAKKKNNVKAQ